MLRYIYKLGFPLIKLYWFLFRPKSSGVKCIVFHGDNIILVRHSYGTGAWAYPGGGINRGETAEQAARREVKEELGLEVISLDRLGEFTSTAEYKVDHVTCFKALVDKSDFLIDGKEIIEAGWFERKNFPQNISQMTQKITAMLDNK
jgi:8-oxo-dGTP pyrophosphatase MutT (NUDIX family)